MRIWKSKPVVLLTLLMSAVFVSEASNQVFVTTCLGAFGQDLGKACFSPAFRGNCAAWVASDAADRAKRDMATEGLNTDLYKTNSVLTRPPPLMEFLSPLYSSLSQIKTIAMIYFRHQLTHNFFSKSNSFLIIKLSRQIINEENIISSHGISIQLFK